MTDGLNYSDFGKIGWQKSRPTLEKIKNERIKSYSANPRTCLFCASVLSYEKRHNKFCSHSCSAKLNNLGNRKNGEEPNDCLCCMKKLKSSKGKFCSNICQAKLGWENLKNKILNGEVNRAKPLRRFVLERDGEKCTVCGNSEWMGEQIPLVVDHINGNPDDNNLENLRSLCCNCDGLTSTYKGRNYGSGRHYRRVRYKEGKSS